MDVNGLKELSNESIYYGMGQGQTPHREYLNILGENTYEFSVQFAKILDELIRTDNRYLLTRNQEEFFNRYLEEAQKITDGSITEEQRDDMLRQFDEFLAQYTREEEDGWRV